MKNFAVLLLSVTFFCCLQASDFIYHIQFKQAYDLEKESGDLENDHIKIIEKIFRDNFNPSGFTQISSFVLKDVMQASYSDFADDDADFVKNRIIMNKLKVTHFLFGEVNNVGDVYYVRVFFSAVNPSFKRIAVSNFDCKISDSLANCTREFAEKFAQNPNIVEEGKRVKTFFTEGIKEEKARLIYGFLNVFPSDIGKYKEVPIEIIKKINASGVFKDQNCGEWRVPTENEVALLASERLIVKAEDYMNDEKGSGWLRPVADCKKSGENNDTAQNNGLPELKKTEVIYGFLKVFPKDIGQYKKRPVEIVDKINSSMENGAFGCKNWRIPTENEVALLASRGLIVKAEEYLSVDGKENGLLRLVADMPGYERKEEQEETDSKSRTESDNKNLRKSKSNDKPAEKTDESEESEHDAKLEQGSRSKPENSTVKHSSKGCAADIL